MNFLVIDDDVLVRLDYESQAEDLPQHRFEFAGSSREARGVLNKMALDGVFSDFDFPGERDSNSGGVEFYKEARRRSPTLLFFFISGHDATHVLSVLAKNGITDVPAENIFSKPMPMAIATLVHEAEQGYAPRERGTQTVIKTATGPGFLGNLKFQI
ncbi:MAG: hypothetical protein P4M15_14775 [Alphaproteobacteria bacterium]|nr:hypothetical protein [Alphaproteobacteria bacterium]